MKMSLSRTIQKLEAEPKDRASRTIYISESIFKAAQEKCKNVSISRLIEEFLKDFAKNEGLES